MKRFTIISVIALLLGIVSFFCRVCNVFFVFCIYNKTSLLRAYEKIRIILYRSGRCHIDCIYL